MPSEAAKRRAAKKKEAGRKKPGKKQEDSSSNSNGKTSLLSIELTPFSSLLRGEFVINVIYYESSYAFGIYFS